jgi:beta-lactamase regulating signal transducer with metallopeptidase domain
MNAIAALLDGPFADALGRALVHLVWQASIVALLLAGTLAAMRRSSANARYAVSCAALVVTIALPVATAFVSFEPPTPTAPGTSVAPIALVATEAPMQAQAPVDTLRGVGAIPLDPALPWVVGFWLAGVTLLSARIGVALVSAHRLADSGIDTLPREWNAILRRLVDTMGIDRAVRLLESTRVDVPTVVGWLRPVILVPASALTGLTPQQLETVLAHELAHIRRHDFVVNLAQTVVETLFFYHPAVWWISNRVRVEREHCCDDAAVAVCGDAVGYARALTTLEEMRAGRLPSTALASTGGSLLERVRRLVGLSDDDLGSTRPIAALIALAIVTAAIAIPLSARVGRSGETSGTTITVDAARSEDDVTGIWVAGSAPAIFTATTDDEDELYAEIFAASELAAAELEVRRAEIERALAEVEQRRDEIEQAVAETSSAVAAEAEVHRAQLERELAEVEERRDEIEQAVAEALAENDAVRLQIAAMIAEAPPAPPVRPTPAAQPAPPAPLAPVALAAPLAPLTPRPPATPRPVIAPVAPVAPLAPVLWTPRPALAPRAYAGSGDPVDPDDPSVDDLVFLHSAGVDADYVRSMHKAGLRGLTARQLAMLHSTGVDAGYATSMEKAVGQKLTWSQLLRLRALDIDANDIQQRRAKGEKVDADSLIRAGHLGIDRAGLDQMRAELDRARAAADEARRLSFEVDDDYIRELESAGLADLSKHEYAILKRTGVDGDWVKEIRAAGYRNFSASELAGLRSSGVDGDYLRELGSAGFKDLSASQLIRLRSAGIDASDLREWKTK